MLKRLIILIISNNYNLSNLILILELTEKKLYYFSLLLYSFYFNVTLNKYYIRFY